MNQQIVMSTLQQMVQQSVNVQSDQFFIKIKNWAEKQMSSKQIDSIQNNKNYTTQKNSRSSTALRQRKSSRCLKQKNIKKNKNKKVLKKNQLTNMILNKIRYQRAHTNISIKKSVHIHKIRQGTFFSYESEMNNLQEEQKQQQVQIKNTPTINKESRKIIKSKITNTKQWNFFDTLNQKINSSQKHKSSKQIFQRYLRSRQKQIRSDELICPVCIEMLIDPVSTVCGHCFCYSCLDQCLLFGATCPVCRVNIKGMDLMPCKKLNSVIEAKFREYTPNQEGIENFSKRQKMYEQWKNQRLLPFDRLKPGMAVDIRDTEQIWCKGKIQKLFYVNGKLSSVLIHYLQWAKLYDEVIEIHSSRLAPRDRFSNRQDIPRYNLNNQTQNLRGAVIGGANDHFLNRQLRPPSIRNFSFNRLRQLDGIRSSLDSIRNRFQGQRNFQHEDNRVNFFHQIISNDEQSDLQSEDNSPGLMSYARYHEAFQARQARQVNQDDIISLSDSSDEQREMVHRQVIQELEGMDSQDESISLTPMLSNQQQVQRSQSQLGRRQNQISSSSLGSNPFSQHSSQQLFVNLGHIHQQNDRSQPPVSESYGDAVNQLWANLNYVMAQNDNDDQLDRNNQRQNRRRASNNNANNSNQHNSYAFVLDSSEQSSLEQ